MAAKKGYFVFHKEFYEIRKELGIKAWYELETYMLQLRFDGVNTDPQTIKNKSIKREWIMIRKKILDSIENMNKQNKHRGNENELVLQKATINDVEPNEFETPNYQNPNKAILSHSNTQDDKDIQPMDRNDLEAKESALNLISEPDINPAIDNSPKKENVLIRANNQTISKINNYSFGFEDFLNEYYEDKIEPIIEAYNSGSQLRRKYQGDFALEEFLKYNSVTKRYKEDIKNFITSKIKN